MNVISRILNFWIVGGSWLWCVSTQKWNQGFVVSFYDDPLSHYAFLRLLTSPCEFKSFFLFLCISGFHGSIGSGDEWNWLPDVIRLKLKDCFSHAVSRIDCSSHAANRMGHQLLLWFLYLDQTGPVLICSNALCCSLSHVHWFPFWRSLMLFVLSARCSENFLNWLTMPKNVLTPWTFFGGCRSAIACSSPGSASIPSEIMMCPRNVTPSY